LRLAHRETTGCSLFVSVYTSGNAQVMAEQSQCLNNMFFKPTSSVTSNCTGVKQLLPNPNLERDADKDTTSTANVQVSRELSKAASISPLSFYIADALPATQPTWSKH